MVGAMTSERRQVLSPRSTPSPLSKEKPGSRAIISIAVFGCAEAKKAAG